MGSTSAPPPINAGAMHDPPSAAVVPSSAQLLMRRVPLTTVARALFPTVTFATMALRMYASKVKAASKMQKVPCGRTREELDEHVAKTTNGQGVPKDGFGRITYNAAYPKANPHTAVMMKKHKTPPDDLEHRCSKCGRTIAQHLKEEKAAAPLVMKTAAEVDALLDKICNLCSDEWERPTPKPAKLIGRDAKEWASGFPVLGPLPTRENLSKDGRVHAIGIGNAYGTGKTELAINGAEVTAARESDVVVAYFAFGNGYGSITMTKLIKVFDPAIHIPILVAAAMRSTRVFRDATTGHVEIQCNIMIFTELLRLFVKDATVPPSLWNRKWPEKLLLIIDSVNRLTPDNLTKLFASASMIASRGLLLVGVFYPQLSLPSGSTCKPLRMHVLTAKETEEVMVQQGVQTKELRRGGMDIGAFAQGLVRLGLRCGMDLRGSTHRKLREPFTFAIIAVLARRIRSFTPLRLRMRQSMRVTSTSCSATEVSIATRPS